MIVLTVSRWLIEADRLDTETIKGAGLEVFESEPYVPKELISIANVVLTPHMRTNTIKNNIKMAKEAAKKVACSLFIAL